MCVIDSADIQNRVIETTIRELSIMTTHVYLIIHNIMHKHFIFIHMVANIQQNSPQSKTVNN
jgi:hypothetical protein